MGSTCLHITRAKHWRQSADAPITREDVEGLTSSDCDFEIVDDAVGVNPETGARIPLPGLLILWHGHADGPIGLNLDKGRLSVMDPDDATTAKMKVIAALFGATVQDDYS